VFLTCLSSWQLELPVAAIPTICPIGTWFLLCVCVCVCITIGLAIPLGKFLLKINGATNRVPVNYLPRRNLYGNSEINSTCSLYCRRITGELKGGGISVEVPGGVDVTRLCVHVALFLRNSLPLCLFLVRFIFFYFYFFCSIAFLNFLLSLHSYYSLLSYFFSRPFAFFPPSRVPHTDPVYLHDVRCSTVCATTKPWRFSSVPTSICRVLQLFISSMPVTSDADVALCGDRFIQCNAIYNILYVAPSMQCT